MSRDRSASPDFWAINVDMPNGTAAYELPGGAIVSVEAWENMGGTMRRALFERDAPSESPGFSHHHSIGV